MSTATLSGIQIPIDKCLAIWNSLIN